MILLFDVGGVLIKNVGHYFAKQVKELLGKQIQIDDGCLHPDFHTGKKEPRVAFEELFGKLTDTEFQQICDIWKNMRVFDQALLEYCTELAKTHTLALASNSDPLNFAHYQKQGYFKPFQFFFFSHEMHLLKPSKEYFDFILEKLQVDASECLLIDDQRRILVAAKKLGFQTHHYTTIENLKKHLT